MSYIPGIIIFLVIPILVWYFLASLIGVKEYSPSSFLGFIFLFASVYIIPLGILLFKDFKTKNRTWAILAMVGSVVMFVFSIFYLGHDISLVREKQDTDTQWISSIIASCQSFIRNDSPSKGDISKIDQEWIMYDSRLNASYAGDQQFQKKLNTPEERKNNARVIAIIYASDRKTGQTYFDIKSKESTNIQAVQITWNVSICDLKNRSVIEKVFVGPKPPENLTTSQRGGTYGISPKSAYQTWIGTLINK
jgi:hypothetical protein